MAKLSDASKETLKAIKVALTSNENGFYHGVGLKMFHIGHGDSDDRLMAAVLEELREYQLVELYASTKPDERKDIGITLENNNYNLEGLITSYAKNKKEGK